ncbi:MAG: TraR/DksA family transcriptional regulator [Desulfobacteraceae bacterium]|nr:TraR/DksA family transcriptional regulator [Desulfobacteraceae bacterium]
MEHREKKILEQLDEKKRQFEQALHRLMENQREYNDQVYGENIMDEFDQAQREISVRNSYRLIERKTKELRMIEELIRKISKDESCCKCEECGESIPQERLIIVPEARLCVSCQQELERLGRMKNLSGSVLSRLRAVTDDQGEEFEEIDEFEDNLEYALADSELDALPGEDVEAYEIQDFQGHGP